MSIAAEQAVLGAVMLDATRFEVLDGLRDEDFTLPEHRAILAALRYLHARSLPFDAVTFVEWAALHDKHDACRGNYALEIAANTASACNAAVYARLVRDASRRRSIEHAAERAAERARGGADPEALVRETIRALLEIMRGR